MTATVTACNSQVTGSSSSISAGASPRKGCCSCSWPTAAMPHWGEAAIPEDEADQSGLARAVGYRADRGLQQIQCPGEQAITLVDLLPRGLSVQIGRLERRQRALRHAVVFGQHFLGRIVHGVVDRESRAGLRPRRPVAGRRPAEIRPGKSPEKRLEVFLECSASTRIV
jgi:hypothetical protein